MFSQNLLCCNRGKLWTHHAWLAYRAVASLSLPDGQDRNISSIFSHFPVGSLSFPQNFIIFFLILVFWVGGLPTREDPGYATACIQRARYMNLLYALTTALRHDTHLATAYFSTKKGNRAIVQSAWDQKCMVNGTNCTADDNYHWIEQITDVMWHSMNQSRNKDLFSCYIKSSYIYLV